MCLYRANPSYKIILSKFWSVISTNSITGPAGSGACAGVASCSTSVSPTGLGVGAPSRSPLLDLGPSWLEPWLGTGPLLLVPCFAHLPSTCMPPGPPDLRNGFIWAHFEEPFGPSLLKEGPCRHWLPTLRHGSLYVNYIYNQGGCCLDDDLQNAQLLRGFIVLSFACHSWHCTVAKICPPPLCCILR